MGTEIQDNDIFLVEHDLQGTDADKKIKYSTLKSKITEDLRNGTTPAGKATNDVDGNPIKTTYAKKSGDTFTGDVHIQGNLDVQGTSYETHLEKVYTKNDEIITRDGATTGLASNEFTGIRANKYDGTNDGRLVFDNMGTARVGDVGEEQPLATRDEEANMTNGARLEWDATNKKIVSKAQFFSSLELPNFNNLTWADFVSYTRPNNEAFFNVAQGDKASMYANGIIPEETAGVLRIVRGKGRCFATYMMDGNNCLYLRTGADYTSWGAWKRFFGTTKWGSNTPTRNTENASGNIFYIVTANVVQVKLENFKILTNTKGAVLATGLPKSQFTTVYLSAKISGATNNCLALKIDNNGELLTDGENYANKIIYDTLIYFCQPT